MDIKIAEQFMKKLIEKSSSYGFEEAEATFMNSSSMSVDILNGEVSSYERSSDQGVSFRGKINGQMGTASTTEFDDDAVDFLLKSALENIEVLNDEDEHFIYCDPEHAILKYEALSDSYAKNTYNKFAEIGLDLEKRILAIDPAVKGVDYLSIGCSTGPQLIINSKGLYAYKDDDCVTLYAGARAERDGVVKSGGYYWYGKDIDSFEPDIFVKELEKRLMGKLGATSYNSGTYDIVLGNEALISFIITFFGNFSGYSMMKGISLLAGKEGETIASPCFTLREDPNYDKALFKLPFDSEGVPTKAKAFIDHGVFNTALYNLRSAHMAGKESTGNGFKNGYKANVATSFTNLIVDPGTKSFDELCEIVGNGVYITELNGLHAGVNTISGDFSLFCEGFKIKNGKIDGAVEQITISDNFYSVLKKISEVGNDVIAEPHGEGEFFCPSVIIKDISVAGDGE
ncbi:MAG: TldD/PmbA family protein [Saccharofermentans sp.]|nr:TldD/PmbA family protein [Saccharofermentans sp.]